MSLSDWVGIDGIIITVIFGVSAFLFSAKKKNNNYKENGSNNINIGNGNQYNAGRDIRLPSKKEEE